MAAPEAEQSQISEAESVPERTLPPAPAPSQESDFREDQDTDMDEILCVDDFRAKVDSMVPALLRKARDPHRVARVCEYTEAVYRLLRRLEELIDEWQDKIPPTHSEPYFRDLWMLPLDYLETCWEMSEDLLDESMCAITALGPEEGKYTSKSF